MASAADGCSKCGFCMRQLDVVGKSETLPCGHCHCLPCHVELRKAASLTCPVCRELFDISGDGLLTTADVVSNTKTCDVCNQKNLGNQSALVFCVVCDKNYCKRHQEAHDELMSDHTTRPVAMSDQLPKSQTTRFCLLHPNQALSSGCRSCRKLLCSECLTDNAVCSVTGLLHQTASLKALVSDVNKEMAGDKLEVEDKEQRVRSLIEKSTRTLSEYDDETQRMMKVAIQTRDEQLKAIKDEYTSIHTKLSNSREEIRAKLTLFTKSAEQQLNMIVDSVQKVMDSLGENDEVEVLTSYAEFMDVIHGLITNGFPSITIEGASHIIQTGKYREIEIAISATDCVIDIREDDAVIFKDSSMNLLKELQLKDVATTVCIHHGQMYVGIHNNVIKVDDEGQSVFVSHPTTNNVFGIAIHQGRMYVLTSNIRRVFSILVYDVRDCRLINGWEHRDTILSKNNVTIVDDLVVVPARSGKGLVIYNLTGKIVKQVSCTLGDESTDICTAGANSVIVSSYQLGAVYKVNIDTEEVVWSCHGVVEPTGVGCYGARCVLVASKTSEDITIHLLNIKTGKWILKIGDPMVREPANVLGIDETENTLVIPRGNSKALLLYKLSI